MERMTGLALAAVHWATVVACRPSRNHVVFKNVDADDESSGARTHRQWNTGRRADEDLRLDGELDRGRHHHEEEQRGANVDGVIRLWWSGIGHSAFSYWRQNNCDASHVAECCRGPTGRAGVKGTRE